jgi:uncharacterized SAM-binding protein YcdF (DUF218 family)
MFYGVGLLSFATRINQSTPAADPPVSDGVVAFTGASDARITAAMKLLETGKAKRMLISGVSRRANRRDIRDVAKATRRFYDCCVDLGFKAVNTVGNGRETAQWARAEGYRTLIVVTADYHMPRAMLELRAALPEAELTPYPIQTSELDVRHWWRTADGARRLMVEYSKYLAVLAREAVLSLGPKDHHAATNAQALPSPEGRRRGPRREAAWEDEGVRLCRMIPTDRNPSPFHAAREPLPLPLGEAFYSGRRV